MTQGPEHGLAPAVLATPPEILARINRGAEKTEAATLSLFALMGFAQPRSGESTVRVPGSFLGGLGLAVRARPLGSRRLLRPPGTRPAPRPRTCLGS